MLHNFIMNHSFFEFMIVLVAFAIFIYTPCFIWVLDFLSKGRRTANEDWVKYWVFWKNVGIFIVLLPRRENWTKIRDFFVNRWGQ